jgi:hypothetical protein
MRVMCFRQAAYGLETFPNLEHVSLSRFPNQSDMDEHVLVGRFVSALERNRRIQRIKLLGLLGWTSGMEEQLDRLFGSVLPNHPSLSGEIKIRNCASHHVELFVSALPTSRTLESLELSEEKLQPSCILAIAASVRQNFRLQRLSLSDCSLGSKGCKMISDAEGESQQLKALTIREMVEPQYLCPIRLRGPFVTRLASKSLKSMPTGPPKAFSASSKLSRPTRLWRLSS